MLRIIFPVMFATSLMAQAPQLSPQDIQHYREGKSFQKFTRFIGGKLSQFQSSYLPDVKNVFYPFGGPDLLYPILLFPKAEKYVLVGLETAGNCLDESNLLQTQKKIEPFLKRGFFITSAMSGTYNKNSGVRSAITLQIMLLGGEIISDEVLEDQTVKITFKLNGDLKKAYYVRKNLTAETDGLFKFLKSEGVSDLCLIKASSYALHDKTFIPFRNNLLKHFSFLLQDDTGVPFIHLSDKKNKFFGAYKKPYGSEFQGYYQPRLATIYQKNKIEIPQLDFCYGYGCGRVQANLLLSDLKSVQESD